MKSGNRREFLNIPKTRSELIELLLLVVVASLGVNLISALISQALGVYRAGICGMIALLLIVLYVLMSRIFKKSFTSKLQATLSTRQQKNKLLDIRNYDFNFDFSMILQSLFSENKALEKQWSSTSLGASNKKADETKSQKLVREIVEYIYLENLSTHLTDYFNSDDYDKKLLVELRRDNVLDLLSTNRVLEMISKDREDRVAFSGKTKNEPEKVEGEIVMSWANGALYHKFNLVLPKGSTISRQKDGSISIDCSSINLNFRIDFKGFNTNVSHLFEKHYMRIGDRSGPGEHTHYQVDIITTINIKPTFIAFGKQLKYHQWAESFLQSIENQMSFDAFLERINWETIEAMIYAGKPTATVQN